MSTFDEIDYPDVDDSREDPLACSQCGVNLSDEKVDNGEDYCDVCQNEGIVGGGR